MRTLLIAAAVAALSVGSAAVVAQPAASLPGTHNAALVTGGTYAVDPGHTQVLFSYNHMGFTRNMGVIAMPTGTLSLDPKAPDKAKLSVTFPVANIRTGIAALDEHMMSGDMFDAKTYPTATFTSTSVKVTPKTDKAVIAGTLTIKGVSKPVTLEASFIGAGTNPMSKKETIGFSAKGTIKRSEFGLGAYVPVVGDAVDLKIIAAFEK